VKNNFKKKIVKKKRTQMYLNKMMINGIGTMNDKCNKHNKSIYRIKCAIHYSNLFDSAMNLSVQHIICLFSIRSKSSIPKRNGLKVKGAMCAIAFWRVMHGLLYIHFKIHMSKQKIQ